MHELSLAQEIIDIIATAQARDGFARVRRVHLEVGQLAGVELPALDFALQALCQAPPLNETQWVFEQPAGRAACLDCGHAFDVSQRGTACPQCTSHRQRLVSGTAFRVVDLWVE